MDVPPGNLGQYDQDQYYSTTGPSTASYDMGPTSSYSYPHAGISDKALGKLPAAGSTHSSGGASSHDSGLTIKTHTSQMSAERMSQLSRESYDMAMEAALLDDQVRDILLSKKPNLKSEDLRRIISNGSYHEILRDLTPYEKQYWTQSMVDLHKDYHVKQDQIKAPRVMYETERDILKAAPSGRVTAEQYDYLIQLANVWEAASDE